MVGVFVILVVLALTLTADTDAALKQNLVAGYISQPPSSKFILGTDALGRDVFARTFLGGRYSLLVAAVSVSVAALVGTAVGLVAGFFGKKLDIVLMRFVDVVLSFPTILLLLVAVSIVGPSLVVLMGLIAAITWAPIARIVRGQVLSLRETLFIEAARTVGLSNARILLHHILPNVLAPIVVFSTFGVASVIIVEAILSYLGLGIQPPTPSWGNLLNTARSITVMERQIWQWMPSGILIVLMVLAVNFVGDGLRDSLDQRSGDAVNAIRKRSRPKRSADKTKSAAILRSGDSNANPPEPPLLRVDGLEVTFVGRDSNVRAVQGISYELHHGETLALVGESGSGKTASGRAIMGLLPFQSARIEGKVQLEGLDLVGRSDRELQSVRGNAIAMIPQDPLSSLNPVLTVGHQIAEVIRAHRTIGKAEARQRAIELLELVEIPDPERRMREYPHQFSGGMRQRAMIAMAISCDPKVLIADEPTTALDVTVQAQILDLLDRLRVELGMAIVFITHDLAAVAGFADRIAVMYSGQIVEIGDPIDVLVSPRHPYTRGLLNSTPRLDSARSVALEPIEGTPPDLSIPVTGCPFDPRCGRSLPRCLEEVPCLSAIDEVIGDSSHLVACWNQVPSVQNSRGIE